MQSKFEDDYRVKALADHYGLDHQLGKLLEEMQEVSTAIDKHHMLNQPDSKWELVCEMADVIFVLRQCLYKLAVTTEDVETIIAFKYVRQQSRIKDDEDRAIKGRKL